MAHSGAFEFFPVRFNDFKNLFFFSFHFLFPWSMGLFGAIFTASTRGLLGVR